MAVPRRKTSPSRRGMRRSADALKKPTYVEDKDSGELRRPHHLDLKTGMYKGRQVLKPKKRSVSSTDYDLRGRVACCATRPLSFPALQVLDAAGGQCRRRGLDFMIIDSPDTAQSRTL